MGLISWLHSKIGMAEFVAEQARLARKWEFAQADDWSLLDADPLKEEVNAAVRLREDDPENGFERLLDLANQGSLYSMTYVAWCYAVGAGVTKDWHQSAGWYRRAYEGGSNRGLLEYGAYLASHGQFGEAEKVYEEGWRRGFVPAVYRLIRIRLKPNLPLKERLAWKPSLEWAAEAGHPAARYLLSKYLFRGWFGVRGIPRGVKLVCAHLAGMFRGDGDKSLVA